LALARDEAEIVGAAEAFAWTAEADSDFGADENLGSLTALSTRSEV
jgi:hypothetical protein